MIRKGKSKSVKGQKEMSRTQNGPEVGEIKYLWSMTRHEWGAIHFYLAFLFVMLMAVHIVLHWTWIKCSLKSLLVFSRKAS
jgi:hypothetical protein